jgi:uncharacterized OB-fold protein
VADGTTAQNLQYAPALQNLVIDENGAPRLLGSYCSACGETVNRQRIACPACGDRTASSAGTLGGTGTVHVHTVVHRSYPGVATPFVAVVVDLDSGGTLMGTLVDVDPLSPPPGRVELVFRDSGQRTHQGLPFLCYYFIPAEKDA